MGHFGACSDVSIRLLLPELAVSSNSYPDPGKFTNLSQACHLAVVMTAVKDRLFP